MAWSKAEFTRAIFGHLSRRSTFHTVSADFSRYVGRLFLRVNCSKLPASEVGQLFCQVSTCRYVGRLLGQLLTPQWCLPRQDVISPSESATTTKESKNACHGVCAWLHFWCCIYYLFSFVFFKYPYTCR